MVSVSLLFNSVMMLKDFYPFMARTSRHCHIFSLFDFKPKIFLFYFFCSWASPSGSWCLPYWSLTWTTRRSWLTISEICSSSRPVWPLCSSSWLSLVSSSRLFLLCWLVGSLLCCDALYAQLHQETCSTFAFNKQSTDPALVLHSFTKLTILTVSWPELWLAVADKLNGALAWRRGGGRCMK